MGFGSIVGGLLSKKGPSLDLSALFDTIAKSGQYEREKINALPEELKPLYEQYKQSLSATGSTLQEATGKIGQKLIEDTTSLYGPESPAVKATLDALRMQNYSTLPGTLTNLKAQLAATGGNARGGASRAITQAVLQPAQQYGQQAANVMAAQLQTQQQNVQNAINTVAALDENTAMALFGMSKEEATNLMTYGREDLRQRMVDLVNQSVRETGQKLGVQGIQTQAKYQKDVAENNARNALINDVTGTLFQPVDAMWQGASNDLSQGASGWLSSLMGGGTGPGYTGDYSQLSNQGMVSTPPAGSSYGPPRRAGGGGNALPILKGLMAFA